MHQPEYAHKDQVDRHDVVEQPWLDQDQDAGDQGDYWLYGDSHQLRHGVAPSASARTRADGFFSHNWLSLPFYREIFRIRRRKGHSGRGTGPEGGETPHAPHAGL